LPPSFLLFSTDQGNFNFEPDSVSRSTLLKNFLPPLCLSPFRFLIRLLPKILPRRAVHSPRHASPKFSSPFPVSADLSRFFLSRHLACREFSGTPRDCPNATPQLPPPNLSRVLRVSAEFTPQCCEFCPCRVCPPLYGKLFVLEHPGNLLLCTPILCLFLHPFSPSPISHVVLAFPSSKQGVYIHLACFFPLPFFPTQITPLRHSL